jgi:hypothetical protein
MNIFSFNRPVVVQEKQGTTTDAPTNNNEETELVVKKSIHPIKTTDRPLPNIQTAIEQDKAPVTVLEKPNTANIEVKKPKFDTKSFAISATVTTGILVLGYVAYKKLF